MALVATDKGGGDFDPAPEGVFVARCVQVIDLGTIFSAYYQKWSHKVLIGWELPTEIDQTTDEMKPYLVWKRYTLSLTKSAALRHDLECWRGRKFSPEELAGFDLSKLLNVPCQLQIQHNESDGKTYANVKAIMALTKGTAVPPNVHEILFFDINEFDVNTFDKFSDHLKETINGSKERQGAEEKVTPSEPVEAPAGDDIPF